MCDEVTESKRLHLEARQRKRDAANSSILDHFEVELDDESKDVIARCADAEVTLNDKPKPCELCKGRGWVKPLFVKYECDACFGTTYDLSNPIAIIKWQRLCMEWAKNDVLENRKALLYATTTEQERQAATIDDFYKDSNRKD
ncbi:hypothetical protein [Vibrio parahaemolyticus]|uniref:hypothetical protein n=1 Tax=Vibrio parahaemolyticus TaxID=670 RepID=UPI003D8173BB